MSGAYQVEGANGIKVIPVADGEFFTQPYDAGLNRSHLYIEFYSDDSGDIPVTPTGGTIEVWGRPLKNNFIQALNSPITATEVETPDSSYTPAIMNGSVNQVKVVLSGVTGATHFSACAVTGKY